MGKILKTVADVLIAPTPDRNANRVRVYRKENGEAVIHFRNLKVTLLTPEDILEWKAGFLAALTEVKAKDYLKNDL